VDIDSLRIGIVVPCVSLRLVFLPPVLRSLLRCYVVYVAAPLVAFIADLLRSLRAFRLFRTVALPVDCWLRLYRLVCSRLFTGCVYLRSVRFQFVYVLRRFRSFAVTFCWTFLPAFGLRCTFTFLHVYVARVTLRIRLVSLFVTFVVSFCVVTVRTVPCPLFARCVWISLCCYRSCVYRYVPFVTRSCSGYLPPRYVAIYVYVVPFRYVRLITFRSFVRYVGYVFVTFPLLLLLLFIVPICCCCVLGVTLFRSAFVGVVVLRYMERVLRCPRVFGTFHRFGGGWTVFALVPLPLRYIPRYGCSALRCSRYRYVTRCLRNFALRFVTFFAFCCYRPYRVRAVDVCRTPLTFTLRYIPVAVLFSCAWNVCLVPCVLPRCGTLLLRTRFPALAYGSCSRWVVLLRCPSTLRLVSFLRLRSVAFSSLVRCGAVRSCRLFRVVVYVIYYPRYPVYVSLHAVGWLHRTLYTFQVAVWICCRSICSFVRSRCCVYRFVDSALLQFCRFGADVDSTTTRLRSVTFTVCCVRLLFGLFTVYVVRSPPLLFIIVTLPLFGLFRCYDPTFVFPVVRLHFGTLLPHLRFRSSVLVRSGFDWVLRVGCWFLPRLVSFYRCYYTVRLICCCSVPLVTFLCTVTFTLVTFHVTWILLRSGTAFYPPVLPRSFV